MQFIVRLNVRFLCFLSLILNFLSISFGILYIAIPIYNQIWDVLGFIYILSLFFNPVMIFVLLSRLNATNEKEKSLKKKLYSNLIFSLLSMGGMLFGNNFISLSYSSTVPDLILDIFSYSLIYFSFFGLLIHAAFISWFTLSNIEERNISFDRERKEKKPQHGKKTKKNKKIPAWQQKLGILNEMPRGTLISCLICFSVLIAGLLCVYILIFGTSTLPTKYIDVSQYATFLAIIFFNITIILLSLMRNSFNPKISRAVTLLGLIISGICIAPLISVDFSISSAELNFTEAFGDDWRSQIELDAEKYFLQTQFSVPKYFLGFHPIESELERHVLFYNGSGSEFEEDENLTLYFDVYLPPDGIENLPLKGVTLIRIHGGGFQLADKGPLNIIPVNKHFARLGVVVFDIQYGLREIEGGEEATFTPRYVVGNFTFDDMVRHIGIFTKYLGIHADEYGANLDSVFFSGGSAGGFLAGAAGFAISSGNYTDLFGDSLTVAGLVLLYPAFIADDIESIASRSDDEFLDPELFINELSPPCLIYQGLLDGLVEPHVSASIKTTYESFDNSSDCGVIYFPFAAHMSDMYFTDQFSQIFLYYTERFMYLYK